jgi:hypothetical protein
LRATESESADFRVDGRAVVYRLYDIAYEIDLERAQELLAQSLPARVRPSRGEAQALQIANPPLSVVLDEEEIALGESTYRTVLSARLFDFGVCSLELQVLVPPGTHWNEFSALGGELEKSDAVRARFDRALTGLRARIAPATARPGLAPVSEEYVVFRVTQLRNTDGGAERADVLTDSHLVPLLLNERRPLSSRARQELLSNRFSYYADDLTILTWDNALVVDPRSDDRDVEYILEFANAQLLELRVYDALLDAELPAMYDRVAAARRRHGIPTRRFQPVLGELQTRVADVTETVERAENALKVTDDVYFARVYAAALDLFRATAWRRGIERKLTIFRETYEMLNAEAQTYRAELLEFAILLIIVAELVLALVKG